VTRRDQLVIPGLEDSPWQLLDRQSSSDRQRAADLKNGRVDGPGRLLRELTRRGLKPDARAAAAALVLVLDQEAPSS
jgi:hypothetical protein